MACPTHPTHPALGNPRDVSYRHDLRGRRDLRGVPAIARSSVAIALSWLAFGWMPQAQAQPAPDNSLQIQRDEAQRQRLRQRMEPTPEVRLQQPAQVKTDRLPQEQPCRVIHSVRAEPALLLHSQLDVALAGPQGDDSPLGRCIGVAGVRLLAQRVRDVLIAQGFVTSQVEVPSQDLGGGNLLLGIVPGRIGSVRGEEETQWHAATLAISPGEILNLRAIEQTLENLRRDGGADVNIQIVPGAAEGSSDILIDHRQKRKAYLSLTVDDSGIRATGKELVGATLSFRNLLGWSELVYVNLGRNLLDRSDEPRGNSSYTLHADLPVGYWLLGATVGGNSNYQTVVGPFQSYRYSGSASSLDVQLSRVMQRDALGKTTVSLGLFSRRSQNYIEDTEVEIQRRRTGGWQLGLSRSQRLGRVDLEASLRYRRGTGAFGALPAPEEETGAGTSRMQLLQAGLQAQMPLRLGSLAAALNSELRLQWHRTPLTPQDRMCLGGRFTVRGFEESQAVCGPAGQLWRNELSVFVPNMPMVGYAGFDVGRVADRSDELRQARTLAGAFAGLRGAFPLGFGQWDVFVGIPLKRPDADSPTGPVAGFQLTASF